MNSRVSIPPTVRLIGLAQPPRLSPFRARPRGLVNGEASRLSAAILSCSCRSRSESFRRNPLSSSLWLPLQETSTSSNSRRSYHAEACLHPDYLKRSSSSKRVRCLILMSPPRPSCASLVCTSCHRITLLSGPSDAFQSPLTRPSVRPCGLTPTGQGCLPQLCTCRGSASHISCWVVHGHPPFRGFSPFVPPCPLRLDCPPCRLPPCDVAAPRI